MEKNHVYFTNLRTAYALVDGELKFVTLKSIITSAKDDKNDVGIEYVLDGKTYIGSPGQVFSSVDHFKKGTSFISSLCGECEVTTDKAYYCEGIATYYRFVDGMPKRFSIKGASAVFDCDKQKFDFFEVPADSFSSRKSCLDHSTFVVVDKDGKKTEHIGLAKLVAITPEQKVIFDQLLEALKAASENNLSFIFDECAGKVFAINVKDGEFMCGDCRDKISEEITDYVAWEKMQTITWCVNDCGGIYFNRDNND